MFNYYLSHLDDLENISRQFLINSDALITEFEKDKIMVRFYYKPLMFWIWLSILLIAFGGIYQTFKLRNE